MSASDYYKKFPPRGPVSELAVKLVSVVSDESISGLEGADLLTIPSKVDDELQEVRETLAWLLASKGAYLFHEEECPWQYGPDDSCDCRVQRAHALMSKLAQGEKS